MKTPTTYIIALILNITFVYGQSDSTWTNNWEKILITDSYVGWSQFNNNYQILRTNLSLSTKLDLILL
jgi:hypothetical protein